MTNLEELIGPYWDELADFRSEQVCHPTFLPVVLTGGIGDVIMAVDALKFLNDLFGMVVYTPHVEAFKYFCPEINALARPQNFSWVLEFDTLVKFRMSDSFSGFLVGSHQELFDRQQLALNGSPRLKYLTENPDKFFLISRYAKEMDLDRRRFPLHCLGYL